MPQIAWTVMTAIAVEFFLACFGLAWMMPAAREEDEATVKEQ